MLIALLGFTAAATYFLRSKFDKISMHLNLFPKFDLKFAVAITMNIMMVRRKRRSERKSSLVYDIFDEASKDAFDPEGAEVFNGRFG